MDRELQKIIDQIRASREKATALGKESDRLLGKLDEVVARLEQAKEMATEIAARNRNRRGQSS